MVESFNEHQAKEMNFPLLHFSVSPAIALIAFDLITYPAKANSFSDMNASVLSVPETWK